MKFFLILALLFSGCVSVVKNRGPSQSDDGTCGIIQDVDKDFTQVTVLLDPLNPDSKKIFFPSDRMAKEAKKMLGQPDYVFCQKRNESKLNWSINPTGRRKEIADAQQAIIRAEAERQSQIALANKPQSIIECGNGSDFVFGGISYTAAKKEYLAYMHRNQFRVTRTEYPAYVAFRGEQNSPFELLISKNGSIEGLRFTQNLVQLPEKAEEQAKATSDRIKGNALVQYEDAEVKKPKFGFIFCEDSRP